MHDPCTQAFDIKYPWKDKPSQGWPKGYRHSFITIWHHDPEKDGTDDSCGWFMRSRHGNKEVLAKIIKEYAFEWQYWFDKDGKPVLSVIATAMAMIQRAVHVKNGSSWSNTNNFMKKHLHDILHFAENHVDSLRDSIVMKYGSERQDYRIEQFASVIYGWILRQERPWYKHPRWHFWHWSFQIHPWQVLRRRYWDKCCKCGKRGFPKGVSAIGNWSGDSIWHDTCSDHGIVPLNDNVSAA